MFPVLFSIGNLSVSSFGVFLAAGFLFGVFLVWRLARAWDLDEEKVLDLTLLTFLGGLLGARLYFILENFHFFGFDLLKWLLIQKYGGFSFWGGFLGGWLSLFYFAKRFKIDFLHILDIASLGLLGGLILGGLGCLLGGCGVGIPSKLFFAVPQTGSVGLRFPVQAMEAALFLIVLLRQWHKATHFHLKGTVASLTLVYIGIIKLLTERLREQHNFEYFFSLVLIALGMILFYKITKRHPLKDFKRAGLFVVSLIRDKDLRIATLNAFYKSWYNYKTGLVWKFKNFPKNLRRLNVKFSHKNSKYY